MSARDRAPPTWPSRTTPRRRRRPNPWQNKPRTCPPPASLATDKPDLASAPNPWDALRVGARVLAAYWNDKREFEGFWLATVKRIENGEFTLEWFKSPQYPAFKKAPKNVAIVHPEFRVTGK